MKFEEMKKIWDKQNQQPLYAINEEALHNRIRTKKQRAKHISGLSEVFIIIVNIVSAASILVATFLKSNGNGDIYSYLLAGLMAATAAFVFTGRLKRKKREHLFDRSMLGDLDHAISNATFQVRLSQIMRWYILPVGLLILLDIWQTLTQIWISVLIFLFIGFIWFAGRWEHQIYVKRKHELEVLRAKLTDGNNGS
ncbi:MAG: hypothetical protein FH748_02175 [Balneolaceae bacterium]|nr:hypothetical protein [Balneolaceae bacterium]